MCGGDADIPEKVKKKEKKIRQTSRPRGGQTDKQSAGHTDGQI